MWKQLEKMLEISAIDAEVHSFSSFVQSSFPKVGRFRLRISATEAKRYGGELPVWERAYDGDEKWFIPYQWRLTEFNLI